MEKIWIVVADSAHARIFATAALTAEPTKIASLEHPAGRLKEQELVADEPGRSHEPLAQGHAVSEPQASAQEDDIFATEIVKTLDDARQKGKFEDLVLVAGPKFLGILRNHLNGPLSKMVSQSLDKNLVDADGATLKKNLFH